jgi:hypothetical protein
MGLTLATTLLHAQAGNDSAAARALFTEGRKLSSEGKWQEACPKFEESLKLFPGTGTRFNLADCWEHIGRTASAWSAFLDVAAEAKAAGQADREQASRERAAALAAKVPRLVIEVTAPEPGLTVQRNGVAVGDVSWGTPLPVDPGTITVQASAPGKKTWSQPIEVSAGNTATLRIPALEATATEAAPAPAAPPPNANPDGSDETSSSSSQKTIAYVVGGVGVVGLVAGTAFFFSYKSNNDDAKAICPTGNDCEPGSAQRHAELLDDARTARTLTYVGWGVGVAALGGAAALYFTAPKSDASSAAARLSVTPAIGPDGAGATLRGAF